MLAIHCGAGRHSQDPVKEEEYRRTCERACREGLRALQRGGSAQEVVLCAVKLLEDSHVTNAGLGSALNLEGEVQCDASIMTSQVSKEGCLVQGYAGVGAVSGVSNPVEVAEDLLRHHQQHALLPLGRIPPLLLVGEGATQWARNRGLTTTTNPHSLITEEASRLHAIYTDRLRQATTSSPQAKGQPALEPEVCDTVGAICYDRQGRLAAAVSSGGIPMKFPGRVGEVIALTHAHLVNSCAHLLIDWTNRLPFMALVAGHITLECGQIATLLMRTHRRWWGLHAAQVVRQLRHLLATLAKFES